MVSDGYGRWGLDRGFAGSGKGILQGAEAPFLGKLVALESAAGGEVCGYAGGEQGEADGEDAGDPL